MAEVAESARTGDHDMLASDAAPIHPARIYRELHSRIDDADVVIGDGGYVTIMEKRGYTRIGAWAPEATVEHPEAGILEL